MGIGHSRKNLPIMPCVLLHTNTTTNISNNIQDAEFVFHQLCKVFSLGLWFMVILINNMDHSLRALSSEWSLARWGQTIQLKPCIFPSKVGCFPLWSQLIAILPWELAPSHGRMEFIDFIFFIVVYFRLLDYSIIVLLNLSHCLYCRQPPNILCNEGDCFINRESDAGQESVDRCYERVSSASYFEIGSLFLALASSAYGEDNNLLTVWKSCQNF